MNEKKFLESYDIRDYDTPLSTVDMAIFAVVDGDLSVLLVERDSHPHRGQLALPGGFIDLQRDADIDAAAFRKLQEKTGVKSPYLEQVETFGNTNRDPRGWSITVLYFALVDITEVDETRLDNSVWLNVKSADKKNLGFDHAMLIEKAHERLISKTTYTALPIELMANEFTLTELQNVFSIILNRKLPMKSFRRRLIDAGMVEETGNSKIAGKRPAKLYRSTGMDRKTVLPQPIKA